MALPLSLCGNYSRRECCFAGYFLLGTAFPVQAEKLIVLELYATKIASTFLWGVIYLNILTKPPLGVFK